MIRMSSNLSDIATNLSFSRMITSEMNRSLLLFVLMGMTLTNSSPALDTTHLECKFHNHTCDTKPELCPETEKCVIPAPGKSVYCHSSWNDNAENGVQFLTQGCWIDSSETCTNRQECVMEKPVTKVEHDARGINEFYFCCCTGNMCNAKVEYKPVFESTTPSMPLAATEQHYENNTVLIVVMTMVALVIMTFIIIVIFYLFRRHKASYHESLENADPTPISEVAPSTPLLHHFMVQLIEVKARGRFGCVWKAQLMNDIVAVKIFPLQDKASYKTERDFYTLPRMGNHDNILHFIGADRRGEGPVTELWLITEYHDHGSLYDYLKANLVSWPELMRISEGLACGLAYLHEELLATEHEATKPAVVHRDLKSKNILLKKDLTACIGDFGLALQFEPNKAIGDTHGQVGTRRYMAPEVLEGAINFNRDAFLRIDMYACGLVLWELASRCSAQDGPVDEYRLPFQDEAGCFPTLEKMQEVVVNKKLRPQLKENWLNHQGLASFCNTIEESWDHDPEARLSAGCVQERICQLILWHRSGLLLSDDTQNKPTPHHHQAPSPAVLPASTLALNAHNLNYSRLHAGGNNEHILRNNELMRRSADSSSILTTSSSSCSEDTVSCSGSGSVGSTTGGGGGLRTPNVTLPVSPCRLHSSDDVTRLISPSSAETSVTTPPEVHVLTLNSTTSTSSGDEIPPKESSVS